MASLKHLYVCILPFLCCGCVGLFPPSVIAQQIQRPPPKLIEKHTDIAQNKVRRPPHVFTVGEFPADQIKSLRSTAGVAHVERLEGGRLRILYQPYVKGSRIGLKQCEELYEHLAIKRVIGKTKWTHGGLYSGRNGGVFSSRSGLCYGMMFNSASTGKNEAMSLNSYSDVSVEQVEHEMLRDVTGTEAKVVRCGKGYAIVSTAGRGTITVWQPTPHQYVRIDNSFDKKMVAAYIERLGSIIPANYKVDVDKWVNNEIKWRLIQVKDYYEVWGSVSDVPGGHLAIGHNLLISFPDVAKQFGRLTVNEKSLTRKWGWHKKASGFLWANRGNFKYDDESRGYVLKGQDRYDPKAPPSLPKELQPPPLPARTRKYEDVLREVESKR